jgi:hypothetical protein
VSPPVPLALEAAEALAARMQGPPPESVRGYCEQMAWLDREGLSVPSAEHALSQRLATLDPDGYNEGGHQATRDYIMRQVSPPEPETRLCAGCGDELNDVEWLFDPCPEDEDGSHRAAS